MTKVLSYSAVKRVAEAALSGSSAIPTESELTVTPRRGVVIAAAALRLLWSLVSWPVDFIKAIHGLEMELGDKAEPCPLRCGDVHADGEECARSTVADCLTCGQTVETDYFGNCALSGDRYRLHPVTNRRAKAPKVRAIKGGDATAMT